MKRHIRMEGTRLPVVLISLFVLSVLMPLPVSPQDPVFFPVAEGYTSRAPSLPMQSAGRIFSTPEIEALCRSSVTPNRLAARHAKLSVSAGEWFDLGRLRVTALDSRGGPLSPVPVIIEMEETDPRLFDLRADVSTGPIMPIRPGHTKFRVRSLCANLSVVIVVEVSDRIDFAGDWMLQARTQDGLLRARLLIEQDEPALLATLFIDNHVLEGAVSVNGTQFETLLVHADGSGAGHSERLQLRGTLEQNQLRGRFDNGLDNGEWSASKTQF